MTLHLKLRCASCGERYDLRVDDALSAVQLLTSLQSLTGERCKKCWESVDKQKKENAHATYNCVA